MRQDAITPFEPTSSLVANICRCSTPHEHASRASAYAYESASASVEKAKREAAAQVAEANKRAAELLAASPNADDYRIEQVQRIGEHLVMQVRYPSCKACEFEGLKTMVFLDISEAAALRWRRIDPHFRKAGSAALHEAPSPAARFPGTKDGWSDAVAYARSKGRP